MNKMTTVIGSNHGKEASRIWLEGKKLVEAGFLVGDKYDRIIRDGSLVLKRNDEGKYKVSGKGEKPIIDTSGKVVGQVFPNTASVEVTFTKGRITIQRSEAI